MRLRSPNWGLTCEENIVMLLERFFVEGLAHSSYLIGSDGLCGIIYPRRHVDIYLEGARRPGLRLMHVIETHLRADFVSGYIELGQLTGERALMPRRAA